MSHLFLFIVCSRQGMWKIKRRVKFLISVSHISINVIEGQIVKIIGIRDACSTADIFNNFQPLLGQFLRHILRIIFFDTFFLALFWVTFLGHLFRDTWFGTLGSGHLFGNFLSHFLGHILEHYSYIFLIFFCFFGHALGHIFGHFQHLAVPDSALPCHRLPLTGLNVSIYYTGLNAQKL